MRSYARNSPQSAARIVALAMLADGHLDNAELEVFERSGTVQALGLRPAELQDIVQDLCADLLRSGELCWETACRVDEATLRALLAEIDDPDLCGTVLRVCSALLDADDHVADGEAVIVAAVLARWRQLCGRLPAEPSVTRLR